MPEAAADDERRLAEALEASVLHRTGRADAVASLTQRSVGADLYSYETRLVEARYASGARETVFLKNFAGSRLPKDEPLRRRRERELAVYERLLPESSLGVPAYIGKVWDESLDRFWLLIEYVPGVELGYRPFERWIDAAAWLGRFHAYADARPELARHPALARHDGEFFGQHSRAARATLGRVSDELARRFAPVAERLRRRDEARVGRSGDAGPDAGPRGVPPAQHPRGRRHRPGGADRLGERRDRHAVPRLRMPGRRVHRVRGGRGCGTRTCRRRRRADCPRRRSARCASTARTCRCTGRCTGSA